MTESASLRPDAAMENGIVVELYGVRVGDRYRSRDKRELSRVRTVLQVQMVGDKPYAQMSGPAKTWITIDMYRRSVNRFDKV